MKRGDILKKYKIFYILNLAVMITAGTAFGAVIHVPEDQPTIQAGINTAMNGDTVLVSDGTYTGTGNKEIELKGKAITVMSANGFLTCIIDCEGSGRSFYINDAEQSDTIIRGFTVRNGSSAWGGGFYVDYSDPVIWGCRIEGNTATYEGGGIYCIESSPTFINCIATNNYSDSGGAIACYFNAEPEFYNCTVAENSAGSEGSAVYSILNSSPVLENCIIWDNAGVTIAGDEVPQITYSDVQGGFAGAGNIDQNPIFAAGPCGGYYLSQTIAGQSFNSPCLDTGSSLASEICLPGSAPELCLSDLTTRYDEFGRDWGTVDMGAHFYKTGIIKHVPADYNTIQGAINAADPGEIVLIHNGTYSGNGNYNLDFHGKAITVASQYGPDYCVIDCESQGRGFHFHNGETQDSIIRGLTIKNGMADYGGGIYLESGSPAVANCIFSANFAQYGGGAILCYEETTPNITNCLFYDNYSFSSGGAIYCFESEPEILNCTFAGNGTSEGLDGGGLYSFNASPQISNTIFWNNSPDGIFVHGFPIPIVQYSDIQEGYTGTGNINEDPLFAAGTNGDYYLSHTAAGQTLDSPCIDGGDRDALWVCFEGLYKTHCLSQFTTRTDSVYDSEMADMGFHYMSASLVPPPPTPTPTLIPTTPSIPASSSAGIALLTLFLACLLAINTVRRCT